MARLVFARYSVCSDDSRPGLLVAGFGLHCEDIVCKHGYSSALLLPAVGTLTRLKSLVTVRLPWIPSPVLVAGFANLS